MVSCLLKIFIFYTKRLKRNKALRRGEFLGYLAWKMGLRKKVVLQNLNIAFPNKTEEWKKDVGKKAYMHLGRVVMEFGKLPDYLCTKKIREFIVIDRGEELLENNKGNGAILVSAHIGNWEMMGTGLASKGYKISALAYKQKNKKVNDLLDDLRTGCCINIVYHRDSVKPLINALKKGEYVVFLVDQNTVKERGVFVDFFGEKALTVNFPAKLAVKLNKPVLFVYNIYDYKEKIYRIFVEEILWDRGSSKKECIENLVQVYSSKIEEVVRQHPDQYLWGHKRWKTRPDGEQSLY